MPSPFMFGPCQPCCAAAPGGTGCACVDNAPSIYARICSSCNFYNNDMYKLTRQAAPNNYQWSAVHTPGAQQNNTPPFFFINFTCNTNTGAQNVSLNCYDGVGVTFPVTQQSCSPYQAIASGTLPADSNTPGCCTTGGATTVYLTDTLPTGLCAVAGCCSGLMPGLLRVTFTTDQSVDCGPCISGMDGHTFDLKNAYNSNFPAWSLAGIIWPCGASGHILFQCFGGNWHFEFQVTDTGSPPAYDNFFNMPVISANLSAPCMPPMYTFSMNTGSLFNPCMVQAVVTQ